ncbi:Lipid A export ATP-binding/permease protein MsbA [Slackia heliotrinireducens]|uniref:ABC-type multidrug transport system, ATPase and permease component n=1 Tax=Slackia heliotrinireducens (strain ATCC 29202 / DSM 20476 / NCTC 11029 / RHS 1) TaxID=471855 RepID=C7N1A0_SLAHD|nr:ABC transporter ATP-binding protein [Slackia heliotrinireducens]ACV23322.1 ABC-type multidrug transport system, ATPase and permease component [Slackia heliotrinireducens DSM 20476]VEH02533.1 Lipid A export ATP-binding/permease protein MsbA [Slackia heliotrinireducens]
MIGVIRKFFAFCPQHYRSKFYKALVIGVLMSFCRAMSIPAIALVLSGMLDDGLTRVHILGSFAIMVFGVAGEGILRGLATNLQVQGGYGTSTEKRIEIAEHMRYLPMGYFNSSSLGAIASVTTNTMENLQGVATRVIMLVSEGILTTAIIAVMLLVFDWRIGLVLVAGCIVFFLVNHALQKRSERLSPIKVATDTELVDTVLEYVQGMQEVKSFGFTKDRTERLNQAIEKNAGANTQMELELVPLMAAQNSITKLTGVAMSLLSVWFYLNGSMSLLVCILMIVSAFMVYGSLESAGQYSGLLRIVDVSVDRANEVLAIEPMDIDGEDIHPQSHDIEVRDVSFSYGQRTILDHVSATIPEGTTTAFVGPSGGGKTTLASLISRFWDVGSGQVMLGGRDVRDYSMDSLMRNFSFVFQNVYLFEDTVANNIRFGQPEAPLAEVVEAAKKARCHDFIMALPQGYDTVIGEGGASLSGGERQRISIARATMKDSPIIVLDEATANVDPENERDLMDAIQELTCNKTVIMIAHRLKTVRDADQILVVDQGRIVQRGTHDELMAEDGIYRRFVETRTQVSQWQL